MCLISQRPDKDDVSIYVIVGRQHLGESFGTNAVPVKVSITQQDDKPLIRVLVSDGTDG